MEKQNQKIQTTKELQDSELLTVRRTTRVTKGGRRYSFQAVVGVGDRKGLIGFARSRGPDVSIAIERATAKARRAMKKVPIINGTIPFEIRVKYKSAVLFLQPSRSGGIIAGGSVRKLCALAGIQNIRVKITSRTKNKINHIYALFKALDLLNKMYLAKQGIFSHKNS